MRKFDVKTRWATYRDCFLQVRRYADNNHVALSVFSKEDGPIANITVNLDEMNYLPENFAYVDTNNFPEAEDVIRKLDIGVNIGIPARSGYCEYQLYAFNMKKLRKFA